MTKVYTLKYDSYVFKSILENFEDIRIEMEDMAEERENLRLARKRQNDMLIQGDARRMILDVLKEILQRESRENKPLRFKDSIRKH